jgi:transcriptional regulator with XRE-family HTH domain
MKKKDKKGKNIMKYDYLKLANIIKECREKYGLSTRELGEKIGVSHTEISRLENGFKANIGVITLEKICEGLEIDLVELLKEIGIYEEQEDELYYVLVRSKNLNCFKINAKTEEEALLKSMDFIIENNLIELDKTKECIDIIIEKNEEDLPKTIEEFDEKVGKNEENFSSDSECESCKNYCPYCGRCIVGE